MLMLLAALLCPALGQAQESRRVAGIDTEHIFGFTEGSDIGGKGEKEVESSLTGRFGKPGSYVALDNETSFRYGLLDGFRISIGTLLDYHGIRNVPDLADRSALNFNGLSSEFRWRVLERGTSPFGLTISFAPQWQRVDDVSGERVQSYVLPATILADVALIPDKMFAAFNLTYAPTFTRIGGAWQQENPLEVSAAGAHAIGSNVFLGAEIRHLTRNQDGFFTGHALFIGPSFFVKLSDTLTLKTTWSAQIPDETTGKLDLVNFERHQARAQFVYGF
jgi:hypothetical protein